MNLTLTPDTEAVLRKMATRHGQTPERVLESLIAHAAAEEEHERQEAAAGVRAGLEDFAAGRWVALEGMEAERRAEGPARS